MAAKEIKHVLREPIIKKKSDDPIEREKKKKKKNKNEGWGKGDLTNSKGRNY